MSRRFFLEVSEQDPSTETDAGTVDTSRLTYAVVDWVECMYFSDVANGEMGELRCIAARTTDFRTILTDAQTRLKRGRFVRVIDLTIDSAVVWQGVIVKHHVEIGGSEAKLELVCYQMGEYLLSRINLHGQHRLSYVKEQAYFETGLSEETTPLEAADVVKIDTALIFNPDGEPNMHPRDFHWANDVVDFKATSGNKFHIFEAPFRKQFTKGPDNVPQELKAVPWKLSDALAYLMNTYRAYWAFEPTSYGDQNLHPFFDNNPDPIISNINLEGKSLLEALRILLVPHNYIFRISPTPDPTTHLHKIEYINRSNPKTTAVVVLSPKNTRADESDANLINASITFDDSAVVNNLLGIGNRIEVTTLAHTNPPDPANGQAPVVQLVPGWKLDQLNWGPVGGGVVNPFAPKFVANYCNEKIITPIGTGANKKGIFGIGRLWIVNQGQNPEYPLADLTTDLAGKNSIDLRQLEPPELFDRNIEGALLNQTDVVVEASFDGGGNWRVVERNWYQVLPSGLGIVFTNIEQMNLLGYRWINNVNTSGVNYWQGLYNSYYANGGAGTSGLQLRILAAIKSDERVKSTNPNDGVAFPLAIEREFENTGFRKIVYNDKINDAVYFVDFPPSKNVRDDTTDLQKLAQTQLSCTDRTLTSGQFVVTLGQVGTYTPGMQISSITNCIDFQFKPTIIRVIYDLRNKHVHLVCDNRQVKTVLKSAPVEGDDLRGHHYGIGHAEPLQGGQQVPFIPGSSSSLSEFFRRMAGGL